MIKEVNTMRNTYKLTILVLLLVGMVSPDGVYGQDKKDLEGRWNLTIAQEGKELPSWLEVTHSGRNTLVGRFVYAFGSARPIGNVVYEKGEFRFSIPPQWERGGRKMDFKGKITAKGLAGTMIYADGKTYSWTAVRAPKLKHTKRPVWGNPITLFNGKDLSGWKSTGKNQWKVQNGILKSAESGTNIYTKETFNDFKLHVEFKYSKNGNSGIYLRGRYEVQITDNKGEDPSSTKFGGVYGFLCPNEMVAKEAGEWQSYDIVLIGRRVTVIANGVPIIVDQIIPGITGGALDNDEAAPGPILIQGDHEPIELRNIVLTPAIGAK
ncbi:3-keto-disaccharide hydrolase [Spongiimicrobium salis]|uniref:3-keto-disaccharide hydrolase n=1 Tax=Spongiimicrobium salis TaxID=1667022 RepID=UPI00374D1D5C